MQHCFKEGGQVSVKMAMNDCTGVMRVTRED